MFISDFIGESNEYDKKLTLEEKRPKSWLKSVSAFADGKGGALFFGVADDETLVGLTDPRRVSEKISGVSRRKWKAVYYSAGIARSRNSLLLCGRWKQDSIYTYRK